jgi:NAD-dependent deacetylase
LIKYEVNLKRIFLAKIVILTGAGISAESGIPTFRGKNGLWNGISIDEVCYIGCLEKNRKKVMNFYDELRLSLEDKTPNKAHLTLAKLKKKYPNEIEIFTQNVDNLFEKADVEVTHLHGELTKLECENCKNIFDIGYQKQENYFNGICPICKSKKLRPFVVFYVEPTPYFLFLMPFGRW